MNIKNHIRLCLTALICIAVHATTDAQTPQYTFTNGSSSNAIPLGSGTSWDNYKSQFLYLPGDFSPVVPTGSVDIITIYFKVGSGTTNTTYSDFTVKIGNTTQTALTTTYITGLSPALYAATYTFSGITVNSWMKIDLGTPVTVDLSKPLVIEVSQTGKVGGVGGFSLLSGGAPVNPIYTGFTQTYGANPSATTGSARLYSYQFGMDLITCKAKVDGQPADKTLCTADSTTFSGSATNAQAYKWQVNGGGGWVNLIDDAVYSGTQTTTMKVRNTTFAMNKYKYRMVAINTIGSCSVNSDSAVLTILPGTNSSIVIAAEPDTNICNHEKVTFHSLFTNGGTSPQYQWLKNGVAIPGETKATLQTTSIAHGDYIQCNLISNGQCVAPSTSAGIIFSVTPMLPASIGISVQNQGANLYTFTAHPQNGGLTPQYYWYINNKMVQGENGLSFTTSELHPYDKVSVSMLSSRDCAEPKFCTSRLATTSVSAIDHNFMYTLSPNPNKGSFIVSGTCEGCDEISVIISNSIGQVVYKAKARVDNGKLNHEINLGENTQPGLYFMRADLGDKTELTKFTVTE